MAQPIFRRKNIFFYQDSVTFKLTWAILKIWNHDIDINIIINIAVIFLPKKLWQH